ncbi:hypothetical protein [Actinoallomurus iriomotensis]|uniref:Type VII secretion system-associated protein n=1 Tax=Actinoallomurus iriomotensis TaxID=478107 RepID=A0A9W6VMK7_9ACTN|nr:hypothetical protein [Actinoallomurus iriomotensis]GLY73790.1 hypothetical protein Airi01_020570 [Actinoallomurus iriomotensis]
MSDDSDGDTLKVTDEYLKGVALDKLNGFIRDLRANPAIAAVSGFANAGDGSGLGAVPGEYTKLLPGGGPLTWAKELQSRFQSLCVSLQTELNALDTTMTNISVDLQTAQLKLQNGEDEALSAAQMVQVLDNVFGGGTGGGSSSGGGTGGNGGGSNGGGSEPGNPGSGGSAANHGK